MTPFNPLPYCSVLTVCICVTIPFVSGTILQRRQVSDSRNKSVIKVISTNTRSGFVNVDAIVNNHAAHGVLDKSVVPDNIYHGAIQAYGKVYDYILDKGIIVTEEKAYYKGNGPLWIDGVFHTSRTEKEFIDWITMEKQNTFTDKSYRLADNNCLTFVAKAAKFLGGKEPYKLWKVRQFALNNRKNSDVLQALYRAWKPT